VKEALHMAGFDERLAEMLEGIHTYLYKDFAESAWKFPEARRRR